MRDAPPADRVRRRMLDVSREGHFKYDLREALLRSSLPPEKIAAFHASIVSKGARIGTQAAKDFVTGKLDEKLLTRPERDAIVALIDRYSRWR